MLHNILRHKLGIFILSLGVSQVSFAWVQGFTCNTTLEYKAWNQEGQSYIKAIPMQVQGARETNTGVLVGTIYVTAGERSKWFNGSEGSASDLTLHASNYDDSGEGFSITTALNWASYNAPTGGGNMIVATNNKISSDDPTDRYDLVCRFDDFPF